MRKLIILACLIASPAMAHAGCTYQAGNGLGRYVCGLPDGTETIFPQQAEHHYVVYLMKYASHDIATMICYDDSPEVDSHSRNQCYCGWNKAKIDCAPFLVYRWHDKP